MIRSSLPKILFGLFTLGLILQPALTVEAAVPSTLSYQGLLTDSSGVAVLDGTHTLRFRIWPASSGGFLPLWLEEHVNVQVSAGQFAAELGSIQALNLAFDSPYWLGVEVDGAGELSPRSALTASPYSLGLRLPFAASLASSAAALSITNSGNGAAIEALGELKVGSSLVGGSQNIYQAGAAAPVIGLTSSSPHGGAVRTMDETGLMTGRLEADTDGAGGFLGVYRTSTDIGFMVDGSAFGTSDPIVSILGSSESAVFDLRNSGDGAVILPPGSISATEVLDEAGVANQFVNSTTVVQEGLSANVAARTMSVPAPGYVLAIGSVSALSDGDNLMFLSVSDSSSEHGATYALDGVGGASSIATVHGIFQVLPGTKQFYLRATASIRPTYDADWNIFARQLTLIYIPSAYGSVNPQTPPTAGSPTGNGEPSARKGQRGSSGFSDAELSSERVASASFAQEQVRQELEALRAELAKLREELSGAGQLQAGQDGSAPRR